MLAIGEWTGYARETDEGLVMVTGDDIGKLVTYWTNGKHVGTLAGIEKYKNRFTAVISTPIAGQRKRRLPANEVDLYVSTETVQTPEALPTKRRRIQ
jgi:hypothetical protein